MKRSGKGIFPDTIRACRRCAGKCWSEGAQETAVCQTKPVDELNVEEHLAHLAWIFLAERMSAGFLDTQIRSGELEKLLRRYLDLTEVEG